MSLDQKDIEIIERIMYKCGDDLSIALGRSFEHLEERIDGAETRIYSRLSDFENEVEANRQETSDGLSDIRAELIEFARSKENL
ncbi:hypothetical protein KGQ27_01280 [Patescibacteria group bacterium]|nr:hypothetical protein [Patescibacteria group bacterium]MDE1946528.1 hypothetical protein [Patescibacteria group bacterium]MDE2010911.1 hypothetical protein [Patescibacteria group bacterium]MDE2232795.1 hypothetical protein [Patescibacteria group bacterium]